MIVKNLWAKNLQPGDLVVEMMPVETRFGELHSFTVERKTDEEVEAALRTIRAAVS